MKPDLLFGQLPPVVRQRLTRDIDAYRKGQPSTVAFAIDVGAERPSRLRWSVYGALALFVALTALLTGFGKLEPAGIQPWSMSISLGLVLAVTIALLLSGWPLHRRISMPLPSGVFFFALDIVDTRGGRLQLLPLRGLRQLVSTDVLSGSTYLYTRLDFTLEDGRSFNYRIAGREAAERALAVLQSRNGQLNTALRSGDQATAAQLDPFHGHRESNGAISAQALAWPALQGQRLMGSKAAVAIVAGMLLAQPLWALRNVASDQVMYSTARSTGTEASLKSYVDEGLFHREAARAALAPAALNDARKAQSVTALRSVLKRYPKAGFEAEVASEIKQIFNQAFERFSKQAVRSDPQVLPFVRALLDQLEASGDSTVHVEFQRPSTEALARTDSRNQGLVPAARHFSSDSAAPRERRIVTELAQGFRQVFPQDVLSLRAAATADPARPALRIAYRISPSGMVYTSQSTSRKFFGVVVDFDTVFSVPQAPVPLRSSLQVLPPDRFTVKGATQSDEAVYVEMADRAFDQLGAKLHSAFFNAKR